MIKIIQPQKYQPVHSQQTKTNKSTSQLQVQEQSQEDSDLEVEVVNTEQRGNELVYRTSNYFLILFALLIIFAYYVQIHHKETVLIHNIEHIEISTIYYTQIQGEKTQVTLFLPDKNINQPQLNAEICEEYHYNGCSRQILLAKGYLFIQIQQMLMKYPHGSNKNVLVFWEEKFSLAILLLNLDKANKIWIDVIINDQDSPIYIQSLRYDLQRYKLDNQVRIMRQMQITSQTLSKYSLIVGNKDILDKIIYPQFLQKAVNEGRAQLVSGIIYNFILKTNLLIYYHEINNQSKNILQNLDNQVTSIKVNQNQEIEGSILEDYNQTFKVIILDGRKKQKHILQKEQPLLTNQTEIVQVQEGDYQQFQTTLQPLLQIPRLQPQKILNFFKCNPQNKATTKQGEYFRSKLRDLLIIKRQSNRQQYQTHIYNFIYHYLQSVNPCNILYSINNQLIAKIALLSNAGRLFLPINLNTNWENIEAGLKANYLNKNYLRVQLDPSLEQFLHYNQIGLILMTSQIFEQYYQIFTWALNSNINIILEYQENFSNSLIKTVLQKYYVFAIFQREGRQFDVKCIKDFDIQYFQFKAYPDPESTYLLISKTDINIQEINPKYYNIPKLQRTIRHKKYQCYRNFDLVTSQQRSNLKSEQIILRVDKKINLILENKSQMAQTIKMIKQHQGIITFLKNSLIVSDNLLIYSSQHSYLFLVINLLKSLTLGQTYFINYSQKQIANIEKHMDINNMKNLYEVTNQKLNNIQIFVGSNKISVLFLSPAIMKDSYQFIPKMKKGSMIFFKYEKKDGQLQNILQKYRQNIKLYKISSKMNENNKNKLCIGYESTQVTNFTTLPQNQSIWLVILIQSYN